METIQEKFSAADGFVWSGDWYAMSETNAQALARRNARAVELKRAGYRVRKSTSAGQLLSFGGIGSGRPHIEVVVNVYRIDAVRS